jgi:hypothetical protein
VRGSCDSLVATIAEGVTPMSRSSDRRVSLRAQHRSLRLDLDSGCAVVLLYIGLYADIDMSADALNVKRGFRSATTPPTLTTKR